MAHFVGVVKRAVAPDVLRRLQRRYMCVCVYVSIYMYIGRAGCLAQAGAGASRPAQRRARRTEHPMGRGGRQQPPALWLVLRAASRRRGRGAAAPQSDGIAWCTTDWWHAGLVLLFCCLRSRTPYTARGAAAAQQSDGIAWALCTRASLTTAGGTPRARTATRAPPRTRPGPLPDRGLAWQNHPQWQRERPWLGAWWKVCSSPRIAVWEARTCVGAVAALRLLF